MFKLIVNKFYLHNHSKNVIFCENKHMWPCNLNCIVYGQKQTCKFHDFVKQFFHIVFFRSSSISFFNFRVISKYNKQAGFKSYFFFLLDISPNCYFYLKIFVINIRIEDLKHQYGLITIGMTWLIFEYIFFLSSEKVTDCWF